MATFYIEAVENTDIALVMVGEPTIGTVNYGVNDTTCPNAYIVTTESTPISLTAGQKCYWTITSTDTAFDLSNHLKFTSTAKINIGGNLSDLIGGDTKIPRDCCFARLFRDCDKLVDASNLIVVDDFNDKTRCYRQMFYSCTSLTNPPALPATTLASQCYYGMFQGCSSLITTPEIPATILADDCYSYMFRDCTSLTTAPTLPATTLVDKCYYAMFHGCTSLTISPELPATTLADYCYFSMFRGCTSLRIPPALPVTTLADYCYEYMFYGCTNLRISETQTAPYSIPYRIPSEGTGTIGTGSLESMFVETGGTFTGTPTINTTYYFVPYAFYIEAVEDTDITLSKVSTPTVGDAYYGVNDHNLPNAYTYGDTIHLIAGQRCYWAITSTTTAFSTSRYLNFTSTAKINVGGNLSDLIGGESKIPRNYCFARLFYNCTNLVSANDLVLVNNFNSKIYCYQYMFNGCTSLTTAPQIFATTLGNYCYNNMFNGCTSLTIPPELPATTLANNCYQHMFNGCTSLTIPPELPATTLATYCYSHMFDGCTSLTTAPELPATTLATYCYTNMFQGCTSLKIAPELPATTLVSSCYTSMFQGCTSLRIAPALPATTLQNYCYRYMFQNCTSLTNPPALPATTLATYCYHSMFYGCTSLTIVPTLPATTLTSNCYNSMFGDCSSIKLSEVQTVECPIPYQIPSEGFVTTVGTNSLSDMFIGTGGTFTGTPTINTIYYLNEPEANVQLYDGNLKLYPITKVENVQGLETKIKQQVIISSIEPTTAQKFDNMLWYQIL